MGTASSRCNPVAESAKHLCIMPAIDEPQFPFEQPEHNLGYLMWQATNEWQRRLNEQLAPWDLTHVQFAILAALQWLRRTQPLVTQGEVAAHARIGKTMMSAVVQTLLAKDWLQRLPHPTDGRARLLDFTPAGLALFAQVLPIVTAADEAFFGRLTTQQPQLAQLLMALVRPG